MARGSGARARVLPIRLRQGSAAHRAYSIVPWVLVVAALAYVPLAYEVGFAPGSIDQALRISQLNDVIAFAVAILGLNLVTGYSGQLSLGQSVFVGIGAYTTVILVGDHGWSYFATVPVSAALCFAVGMLVGIPAMRISGLYLAIVTLAMAYVFPALVLRYDWLTGGPNGKGPERGSAELVPPSWLPFADAGRLAEPLWVYTILIVMAAVLFLLARNFVRSRPGRALMAVRDSQTSATASGVNVAAVQGDGVRRERRVRRPRRIDADDEPALRVGCPVRHAGRDLPRRRARDRRRRHDLRCRARCLHVLLRAVLRRRVDT